MEVATLLGALAATGPLGIAGIALAEKFLPVVPSYVVFVGLGMAAASSGSDLIVTAAAVVAGSTLGAIGWYALGLALGQQRIEWLVERFGRFLGLDCGLYHRMAGAYRRHGFWVTLVGQTIPVVRVYLSVPAGVLRLAIANFIAATLIGSLMWSGPLLALGYFCGGSGADLTSLAVKVLTALVAVELLAAIGWRLWRSRR